MSTASMPQQEKPHLLDSQIIVEEAPAISVTLPPSTTSPLPPLALPTSRRMLPPWDFLEGPGERTTSPLARSWPVLMFMAPDTPRDAELSVKIVTLALLPSNEGPDLSTTEPPLDLAAAPPEI